MTAMKQWYALYVFLYSYGNVDCEIRFEDRDFGFGFYVLKFTLKDMFREILSKSQQHFWMTSFGKIIRYIIMNCR